jgi:hypothetical protein
MLLVLTPCSDDHNLLLVDDNSVFSETNLLVMAWIIGDYFLQWENHQFAVSAEV